MAQQRSKPNLTFFLGSLVLHLRREALVRVKVAGPLRGPTQAPQAGA